MNLPEIGTEWDGLQDRIRVISVEVLPISDAVIWYEIPGHEGARAMLYSDFQNRYTGPVKRETA